jgi:hypothetical protein
VILLQIVPARTYKGTNKNPLTGPLSLVAHKDQWSVLSIYHCLVIWSWSWRGGTKTGRGWFLGIITCMVLFRERSTSPAHAGGLYNKQIDRSSRCGNQSNDSVTKPPPIPVPMFACVRFDIILAATDTLPCVKPHPIHLMVFSRSFLNHV